LQLQTWMIFLPYLVGLTWGTSNMLKWRNHRVLREYRAVTPLSEGKMVMNE
jgi:hypothetical protein